MNSSNSRYINISKSGISTNIGVKGANVTIGPKGTFVNTGLPGSGLYRRDKVLEKGNIKDDMSEETSAEQYTTTNKANSPKESFDITELNEDLSVDNNTTTVLDSSIEQTRNGYTANSETKEIDESTYNPKLQLKDYQYPSLDLLRMHDFDDKPNPDKDEKENSSANNICLANLLHNFGIQISEIKSTEGPKLTLFEITLAPGNNLSMLRGLEDDIALALCSYNVQIISPVSGKGTIGIIVPKIQPEIVPIRSILDTEKFEKTTSMDLPCAIGRTITNEVFMFDLTKAPHVLIAGSTGQGKSVTINVMLISLLFKKHPSEMKLILMEPSGLELGPYSCLKNHFLASLPETPTVVSNTSQVISTLNSLCREMDRRYELLRMAHSPNVKDYNRKFNERQLNPANGHQYMPFIVVVIDEFGFFLEEKGDKIEQPITQLAKFARAAGIHMILSTRRLTKDIITDSLKQNIPTRISFRVPERKHSQIILERDGAEQLLGNGDMLYSDGGFPLRIQGAFVDTKEVDDINEFISKQQGYPKTYVLPNPNNDDIHDDFYLIDSANLDPLFENVALDIVLTQLGSTTLIQRRFSIGYNRAFRLMDQLEKAGIVGKDQGSKPREVLIADEMSLNVILAKIRK